MMRQMLRELVEEDVKICIKIWLKSNSPVSRHMKLFDVVVPENLLPRLDHPRGGRGLDGEVDSWSSGGGDDPPKAAEVPNAKMMF